MYCHRPMKKYKAVQKDLSDFHQKLNLYKQGQSLQKNLGRNCCFLLPIELEEQRLDKTDKEFQIPKESNYKEKARDSKDINRNMPKYYNVHGTAHTIEFV